MFGKLLVALDGSRFAECALEPAFTLAGRFGSEVILLRVIGTGRRAAAPATLSLTDFGPQSSTATEVEQAEAEGYLRGVQERFQRSGMNVKTEIGAGEAATAITALAESHQVDLIIMSTHGRSGFMRLLYGSVAEAVLRGAHIPLLLIPLAGRPALEEGNQLLITPSR